MTIQERNKMVEENINLVRFVLKRFGKLHDEDLFQEGVIELIRSAGSFKPELGKKFSTYAVKNIYFRLIKAQRKSQLIRPTRKGGIYQYAPVDFVDEISTLPCGVSDDYDEIELRDMVDRLDVSDDAKTAFWETCFESKTQKQVGLTLGISQVHTSRLINKVKKKLQDEVAI